VPATTTPAAAQTQAPTPDDPQKQVSAPATYNTTTTVVPPSPAAQHSGPAPSASDSILEAELRTLLVDKPLFLRGCYSSDDLRFNERGGLYDSSPRGSFTLSGVQIERLRLTRKELILEGDRYGYRFLGALPGNNPTEDMERIKITPKKKVLRIRIEREEVISPKKEKEKPAKPESGQPPAPATAPAPAADTNVSESADNGPLKDEPVTVSPEHAVARLKETLARLFTPALDDRFVGSMPPFWQLYYKRLAAKSDYHPSDPSVLRQSQVDKKARLLSAIDPPSNAFAQDYGVAGMARYHVVVGPDGKPGEIAIGQPIGFGLDENAVDTLKKASFEPAVKDGKPVSVVLDLDVQFHIYSKLTSGTAKTDPQVKPALPGPYSLPSKP
jgi:outer membrane biosynthesis protein TonB